LWGGNEVAVSKRSRFEVFKRDGFACAYCGKTPPAVILEIDHMVPVSLGGDDNMANLVTACFDCNRGKSNVPLGQLPPQAEDKLEGIREREEQIRAYYEYLGEIENRLNREAQEVADIYTSHFPEWELSEEFKRTSIKRFLKSLNKYEVIEAMDMACSRVGDSHRTIKYFCGICWKKIKGGDLEDG
jgi:CRISPR/Cas system Type II protein with McrA/HNH and RuvC-like nuclease domain